MPLKRFSRLITFDKRGTGLSDRDVEDPTLEARMDDIRAVMDAAGSKRAAMLGISEGGPMAAMFAATYPERTRALVLYGSFAEFSSWVPTPERLRAVEDYIDQAWGSGGILVSLAPHLAEDESFRAWWRRHERLAASPSAALALMFPLALGRGDADRHGKRLGIGVTGIHLDRAEVQAVVERELGSQQLRGVVGIALAESAGNAARGPRGSPFCSMVMAPNL